MNVRQSADDIMQDAARWVMRIDREERTPEIEHELAQWMAGDPRRSGALLQAEAVWCRLDAVGGQSVAMPADYDDDDEKNVFARPRGGSRRYFLGAVCGGIAASLAGMFFFNTRGETFKTAVGEVRRVPLADRSTMAINTDSQIRVAYANTRREVAIDQGEAWFHVVKDKSRPFIVSAGPIRVEAVGTAFSVRRRGAGAEVMVTEGVVRVWVEGAEASALRLAAGSMMFVADKAATKPQPVVAAPTIERKLAWRAGQLNLAGETLADAVAEFNRYNSTQIIVQDSEIAGKRLYGTFRLDDPEAFARTAAVTLGTSASGKGGRIVIAETKRN